MLIAEQNLNTAQKDFVLRIGADFPYYAEHCLKLRAKSGRIEPFILNTAQQYIHERLEAQKAETGRVKALILKGRQQGCSTYVEGRFYHRAHMGRGLRAFILSHESDSALNLFNMAKRFHDNCPEGLRPMTERSNRQELIFAGQDCSYRVATAGADAVGRSETIQLFHGSEVAFWPHADDHASGAMQAVPDEDGTEIVLESTANGMANLFHSMWVMAERGESDYQAIFVPWFWQDEYKRKVPDGFNLSAIKEEEGQLSEVDYAEAYNLSLGHMAWRRAKIAELGINGAEKFRREYPASSAEAFQTSGKGLLIPPEDVIAARKLKNIRATGPRIGACDPAGDGEHGDRTVIAIRQGRIVLHVEIIQGRNTMEVVARIVELYRKFRLDKMFIEKDGLGAGIVDRAKELTDGIIGVNAGNVGVMQPDRYFNKRAECAGRMAEWFADKPVSIPDDDEIQADFSCMRAQYDSNSRLKLESKIVIRRDFGISPDIFDAIGLTFAFPVTAYDRATHKHEFYVPNEGVNTNERHNYKPGRSANRNR